MEELISISNLMLRDHSKIGKLLSDLDEAMKNNSEKVIESFHEFSWNLEKHFNIEENIVLTNYNPKEEEIITEMPNILEEHEGIIKMMKEIEAKLVKNGNADISHLKMILIKHKDFENEVLYPLLDLELNKEQKKSISEKIMEQYKW